MVHFVENINEISKENAVEVQSALAAAEEQSASMQEITSSSQELAAITDIQNRYKNI